MQPRSCLSPFFRLFMVTKTPQGVNSFLGVFSGASRVFSVSKYVFTAFRARCTMNLPSSMLSSNGNHFSSIYSHSKFLRGYCGMLFVSVRVETRDLKFCCFFRNSFFGYNQEVYAIAAQRVSAYR